MTDVSAWLQHASERPDIDPTGRIHPTSKADATIGRLLKSQTNTGAMLQRLHDRMVAATRLLNSEKETLEDAADRALALQNEVRDLIARVEEQGRAAAEDASRLRGSIATLTRQRDESRSTLAATRESLEAANRDNAELVADVARLEGEVTESRKRAEDAELAEKAAVAQNEAALRAFAKAGGGKPSPPPEVVERIVEVFVEKIVEKIVYHDEGSEQIRAQATAVAEQRSRAQVLRLRDLLHAETDRRAKAEQVVLRLEALEAEGAARRAAEEAAQREKDALQGVKVVQHEMRELEEKWASDMRASAMEAVSGLAREAALKKELEEMRTVSELTLSERERESDHDPAPFLRPQTRPSRTLLLVLFR